MAARPERYDLVFADPPYALLPGRASDIFRVAASALAEEGGALVCEMPGELELAHPGFTLVRRLGKGRHQPSVACF
jgi:16S rRNA G966 N2-methylase RsmD